MKTFIQSTSRRRRFVKSFMTIPFLATPGLASALKVPLTINDQAGLRPPFKFSLNAYSFNALLSNGSMTIDDMLEFCSGKGFLAVDITAYYFPGYPGVPSDEYLYHVKRKAFELGLEISGTGVRNDFTDPDPARRQEGIALVKNWINAAEKIGAPVIRIFSGYLQPEGYTRQQVLAWMLKDIQECVAYGRAHGVIVGIQNHNDFIKTSDHVIEIVKAIDSEWFGLVLDIGSFQNGDPYQEIQKTVQHAVSWQVKERVYVNGKEVDVDLDRLFRIIAASGYSGYLPLETLGTGDPKIKISALLKKVERSLAPYIRQ